MADNVTEGGVKLCKQKQSDFIFESHVQKFGRK